MALTEDDLMQGIPQVGPVQNGLPPVLPSLSKPKPKPQGLYSGPGYPGMGAEPAPAPAAPAMPFTGLPPVTTLNPSPEQQAVGKARNNLESLQAKPSFTQNLWNKTKGSDSFIGKLGHVGAGLLRGVEVGGEILAPRIAAEIPGTTLNRSVQIEKAKGDLTGAEANAKTAAETGKDTAEAERYRDEVKRAGQPKPVEKKYTMAAGVRDAKGEPAVLQTEGEGAGGLTAQPGFDVKPDREPVEKTPPHITREMGDGKPHIMERDPATGEYSIDRGIAPPNYAQVAPDLNAQRMKGQTKEIVDADGITHQLGWNPKTQRYDIDMGVSGAGTQGSRLFASGISKKAGDMLIRDITDNKSDLGSLATWVQKYGLNTPIADPSLARLQAELASFAALQPAQHGFRSQSAMEAFEKIIGGLQQNPDATIATIKGITETTSVGLPSAGGDQQEKPVRINGKIVGYTKDGKTYSRMAP